MLKPDALPRAPGRPSRNCGWLVAGEPCPSSYQHTTSLQALLLVGLPAALVLEIHCSSPMPEALAWKGWAPTKQSSSFCLLRSASPRISLMSVQPQSYFPRRNRPVGMLASPLNCEERSSQAWAGCGRPHMYLCSWNLRALPAQRPLGLSLQISATLPLPAESRGVTCALGRLRKKGWDVPVWSSISSSEPPLGQGVVSNIMRLTSFLGRLFQSFPGLL